jgi:hypothetical protein
MKSYEKNESKIMSYNNKKKISTPNDVLKGDLRGWRKGKWGGEARKQRQGTTSLYQIQRWSESVGDDGDEKL